MATLKTSIVIKRPVDEVYKYVVDVEKCPEWRTGCLGGKRFSQGPIGVSTTEMHKMKAMGRTSGVIMEVTEYEPNRKYGWKATSGDPFPFQGWFTFEAAEGGAKVTETVEAKLGGFLRLIQPVIVRMFRREMQTDFSNLKRIMEAGG